MKKRCSILLAACLMIAALTGCSQTQTVEQTSAQTTEVQQTEETQQEKEVQTFSIGYPSYLQESQGEALVLEEKPEDIVGAFQFSSADSGRMRNRAGSGDITACADRLSGLGERTTGHLYWDE